MKSLYLIRHAKAGWDHSSQSDIERPLNEHGEKDAHIMAKLLIKKNIYPDLIINSPAVRAFTTAEIFANELGYDLNNIISDARIYEATMRDLAEVVREINDIYQTVFMFGHNPGMSNFTNLVSDRYIDSMPTCAVSGIELRITSWTHIERHCGKLKLFEFPKQ